MNVEQMRLHNEAMFKEVQAKTNLILANNSMKSLHVNSHYIDEKLKNKLKYKDKIINSIFDIGEKHHFFSSNVEISDKFKPGDYGWKGKIKVSVHIQDKMNDFDHNEILKVMDDVVNIINADDKIIVVHIQNSYSKVKNKTKDEKGWVVTETELLFKNY